jgi:hypothetical protein
MTKRKRRHPISSIAFQSIHAHNASARRSSIAEAAVLAAGGFGAIFIADIRPVALLLPEVGPPTLCSR